MEISVVCKYNQARSIIGAAAIRKFYPEITVHSSGIFALSGGLIPASIRDIAQSWKLPIQEIFSTPVAQAGPELTASDLIIGADEEVSLALKSKYPESQIRNLQDAAMALEFTPHDPSGMSGFKTEIELAKVVALTLQEVRAFIAKPAPFPITLWIPRSPHSETALIKKVLAGAASALTIDLNFRTPSPESWRNPTHPVRALSSDFLGELSELVDLGNFSGSIISPTFEATWPESLWTDPALAATISKAAEKGAVNLVTAPLTIGDKLKPDAFLASICATEIHII